METVEAEQTEAGYVKTSKTGLLLLKRLKKIGVDLARERGILEETEVSIDFEREKERNLLALRWYGGKYSHLWWLLPLLPSSFHFVEPFGGAASVLLNREPSPIETYNDIDSEVVNFFNVLRTQPESLISSIYLTPFSHEEYNTALKSDNEEDVVERARRFFVKAEQVRVGLAQTATPGRWAWCKLTSRRNMAGAVSRWQSRIEALWLVSERLKSVQIENKDALEVIRTYDNPKTLFYCDPPYHHATRGDVRAYAFEYTERDYEKLVELLNSVEGMVAVSGYRSKFMDGLYENWTRIDAPKRTIHSAKVLRQESLWVNYDLSMLDGEAIGNLKRLGFSFHINEKQQHTD